MTLAPARRSPLRARALPSLAAVLAIAACNGSSASPPPRAPQPVASVAVTVPPSEDGGAAPSLGSDPATTDEEPRASEAPVARSVEAWRTWPRHRSTVLGGPPKPARLAPGDYACRTGAEYRYRPCTVQKDGAGFTWVDMPGSLLGLRAVVYDEGASLVVDGASADERPFGCFSCQERCTRDPSSCGCVELMDEAIRECLLRPIRTRLAKRGSVWTGTLQYATYVNRYEGSGAERHVTGWDPHMITLLVEIAPKSALPKPKPANRSEVAY